MINTAKDNDGTLNRRAASRVTPSHQSGPSVMHGVRPQTRARARWTRHVLLATLGPGLIALGSLLAAASQASAVDAVTPSGLEKAITETLEHSSTARAALAARERTPLIDRKRRDASRRWVFGSAVLTAPRKEGAYPEGWLFVAHASDRGWKVGLEGTRAFGDLAEQAPASVVGADEKRLFAASAASTAAVDLRTRMRLPWAKGQAWTMTGGPHNSGFAGDATWSSFDFTGGDSMVRAVRSGHVYKMCANGARGWLRVIHDLDGYPAGYASDYYHLANNIKPLDGSLVSEGDFLGYTGTDVSCGGQATGAHVHFSVRRYGQYAAVHGLALGGWTFYNGATQYQGYARLGSTLRSAGQPLMNYGALALNQGVVDSNGVGYVNVRSGPGTNYPIVGRVNDGDIVTVICTGSGTTHGGRYGSTNLWDRLPNGIAGEQRWISDAFLDSRIDGALAGPC
jgi:LasA protease